MEALDQTEDVEKQSAVIKGSRSHVYLHNKQTRVPYDVGNKIKG